jgi:predicted DCC family thiol-disulfide oxidoreductase YuxK
LAPNFPLNGLEPFSFFKNKKIMIKILYDHHCSLCSKEINYYRSIAPKGIFLSCNLHAHNELLRKYKITHKEALLSLHAIDTKEKLYRGVDAFCLIWNHLRGWRLLSFIIKMPLIYTVSKVFYSYFARWRFNKMKYCRTN